MDARSCVHGNDEIPSLALHANGKFQGKGVPGYCSAWEVMDSSDVTRDPANPYQLRSRFIRHALDDTEPIPDLQGKQVASAILPVKWGHSVLVTRAIPSGAAVAQCIERFQVGPHLSDVNVWNQFTLILCCGRLRLLDVSAVAVHGTLLLWSFLGGRPLADVLTASHWRLARCDEPRTGLCRRVGPRWLSGKPARLPPRRSRFNPRLGNSGNVGIVSDGAVGRRVFSRGSPVTPPFHSGAAPYSPQSSPLTLKTSISMTCMLDSTILCTVEPQMFVDWLLPQCYPTFDRTGFASCYIAKSAIDVVSSRAFLINSDPIAKEEVVNVEKEGGGDGLESPESEVAAHLTGPESNYTAAAQRTKRVASWERYYRLFIAQRRAPSSSTDPGSSLCFAFSSYITPAEKEIISFKKARRGEHGAAPEWKAGGKTGELRENPPTSDNIQHDYHVPRMNLREAEEYPGSRYLAGSDLAASLAKGVARPACVKQAKPEKIPILANSQTENHLSVHCKVYSLRGRPTDGAAVPWRILEVPPFRSCLIWPNAAACGEEACPLIHVSCFHRTSRVSSRHRVAANDTTRLGSLVYKTLESILPPRDDANFRMSVLIVYTTQGRLYLICTVQGSVPRGIPWDGVERGVNQPTRVKRCEYEATPEIEGRGETGDSRENPPKRRYRPARLPTSQNPVASPPGIEPRSPWWEASNLRTTPPRHRYIVLPWLPACRVTRRREKGDEEGTGHYAGLGKDLISRRYNTEIVPDGGISRHAQPCLSQEDAAVEIRYRRYCSLLADRARNLHGLEDKRCRVPAKYSLGIQGDLSRHRTAKEQRGSGKVNAGSFRCRGGLVVRLLTSLLGEPGSIPGGVTTRLTHLGIVPDNAAGRRVFSGLSRFPLFPIPALLCIQFTSPSSTLKTSLLRATQISSLTHSSIEEPKSRLPL
ncbi:hypothetical protein PR048_031532 [Dryococelus australis]|uniref:C3H1-type domain-containing protein n=1 Tax=Dryococelus australis TaxID=614101 RepID=A0ABQ9G5J8_9NEOP|nr:hypothetical protein PR048_031532 [Dryococelus australis]